ncbi:MAG: ATP-binding cassette domain-containing protein [Bacteroidales bacterium]|nr:ATP-binding cassette domain-containing protein [Bacteroidales bacterium]
MTLISASKVVKDFSGHRALNHVSMEVPEGSIYGLLGPNGAGKTTLLRIINQITAPDQGSILFEGSPIGQEHRPMIGYLPEERGLYKKMKVGEQALYLAQLKGLSRKDAMDRLKLWFRKFEMESWWDKKVEELSKGMAQKVQFITTVLHQPRLLIFDEPFSGFDPINVNLLKQEILQMKEQGATIIFSTHNMASVEELCDHITLINESEVVLQGEISEIRERYRSNKYRVTFSGSREQLSGGLDPRFELLAVEENGMGQNAIIRIRNEEEGSGKLIRNLLDITEIKAFNEILPGMNDIFIQVVHDTIRREAGHE